jgi:hypothetical protein
VIVGSIVTIDASSHSSRVLNDRKLIHLDGFLAPRLFLVVAPGAIAETLEHPQAPVPAADICRRTLDREHPLRQMAAATLGTGMLTSHPIPVPFEGAGVATRDEPLAILALGAAHGLVGITQRTHRLVPFLLHTGEFRLRHAVLAFPQIEHRRRPEVKSLHRLRAFYKADSAAKASA